MSPSRWRRVWDGPPFTALGLVWPFVPRGSAAPVPVADERSRFTLVSSNALGHNDAPARYAAALTALDADVFVVVEASDVVLDALDDAEIDHHHGPGVVEHRPKWSGCGIWSRYPTERLEAGDAGHAYLAARVHLPAGPVDVVAVHTFAPVLRGSGRRWRGSFTTLEAVVGRLRGPVVLAGDWNATMAHHPLRAFLAATGLRDAHTAVGRGRARSWPVSRWLPLLGLIDRVVVSDEIAVLAVAERRLPGSDHLAVEATLALKQGAAAPG